jgi:hypothetical protein
MINVRDYIHDEIDYINNYGMKCDKQDIKFLENLNDNDINIIQEQVERDDELHQCINETLNYYVYHYIEKKKESENNG